LQHIRNLELKTLRLTLHQKRPSNQWTSYRPTSLWTAHRVPISLKWWLQLRFHYFYDGVTTLILYARSTRVRLLIKGH